MLYRLRLSILLLATALTLSGVARGQKQSKQEKCKPNAPTARNWEQVGESYMYFGYTLCPPAATDESHPPVTVWLTFRGDDIRVSKLRNDAKGAEQVVLTHSDKKTTVLFRDLDAVPVGLLKAESRGGIPAAIASQPLLLDGQTLVSVVNLSPEAATRITKIFDTADMLIQKAESEVVLMHEADKLKVLAELLSRPFKAA